MKKIVSVSILIVFLGTVFLSLLHMSTGMDVHGGMADCPFMTHQDVICPMDLADHLGAWKSIFTVVVPTVLLLIGLAGTVAITTTVLPHLFARDRKPIPISFRYLRERTYTFSSRPFQELFSSGILHPKLF